MLGSSPNDTPKKKGKKSSDKVAHFSQLVDPIRGLLGPDLEELNKAARPLSLKPEHLRWRCPESLFPFETTSDEYVNYVFSLHVGSL